MRLVPWWAVLSAACAPVVLIGGWLVAGQLQGPDYDPVNQTISALAAVGAPGRWLMVAAMGVLGSCHLITAYGLRVISPLGRVVLAAGGISAFVLALSPEPHHGGSQQHGTVAAVGFALLCVWPSLAAYRSRSAPWVLKPLPALLVTALMVVCAGWFLVELRGHGPAGLAERVLTAAQTCWPLVVALACLRQPAPATVGPAPPKTRSGQA